MSDSNLDNLPRGASAWQEMRPENRELEKPGGHDVTGKYILTYSRKRWYSYPAEGCGTCEKRSLEWALAPGRLARENPISDPDYEGLQNRVETVP